MSSRVAHLPLLIRRLARACPAHPHASPTSSRILEQARVARASAACHSPSGQVPVYGDKPSKAPKNSGWCRCRRSMSWPGRRAGRSTDARRCGLSRRHGLSWRVVCRCPIPIHCRPTPATRATATTPLRAAGGAEQFQSADRVSAERAGVGAKRLVVSRRAPRCAEPNGIVAATLLGRSGMQDASAFVLRYRRPRNCRKFFEANVRYFT